LFLHFAQAYVGSSPNFVEFEFSQRYMPAFN
jgi:hypothetical protein